jgi:hypothetical protein
VTVVPMPAHGEWLPDARSGDRALRASWHLEQGCVVVSIWRGGMCTGTARLGPPEAARLVAVLAEGLGALGADPGHVDQVGTG